MTAVAEIERLTLEARHAARAGDWRKVSRCAAEIIRCSRDNPEGHFLAGLVAKAEGQNGRAAKLFKRALQIDGRRYDAAIELADLYLRVHDNSSALRLLQGHERQLDNSPLYLEMAASAYSRLDLHEAALPLYRRACELQPAIERFRSGLAACYTYLGESDAARGIYEELLKRHPRHQRFHYELAQLRTAADFEHVAQMKGVLDATSLPPEKNIFLWYALGKELEDLEQWDEAFRFYEKAGNAVKGVAEYEVETDIRLVDALIETCNEAWLRGTQADIPKGRPTPIFIVGLPRSGTTLVERILASHSRVESIGETFFLQLALSRAAGSATGGRPEAGLIPAAAAVDPAVPAAQYMDAVSYKLGNEPFFIEKLPENFFYLGFIAKAFPDARIVHLRRHPMDVCFAMYKQSYFRFAYTLDDVGRFYVAYDRLMRHWHGLLGDKIKAVKYEDLVGNSEHEIRRLLDWLDLEFEAACLAPEKKQASSRTASKVQVREGIHRRSVDRWRHFGGRLAPLERYLVANGIKVRNGRE